MSLTMRERQIVIKGMAGAYRRASKKEKGRILEQVVEATGYLRRYAARLLRGQGRRIYRPGGRVLEGDVGTRIRRERRRQYGEKDKQVRRRLWEMLGYVSGRRLAAALPDLIESLERHGERVAEPPVRARLLKISASTIDRRLSEDKRRMRLKGRRDEGAPSQERSYGTRCRSAPSRTGTRPVQGLWRWT